MRSALGWLAATAVSATLTLTSPAMAGDLGDNAALRYWRAFALMADSYEQVGNVHFDRMGRLDWTPPPGVAEEVASAEDVISMLRESAAMDACDFGVDWEKGPAALLPHLSPMRRGVRLLAADARLRLLAGDVEGFTASLEAAFGMTHDAAGERIVIGSLVSMACFAIIEPQYVMAMEADFLSPAQRDRLCAAIGEFNGADPFGIRFAVRGEREIMGSWLRGVFEHAPAGQLERFARGEIRADELEGRTREAVDMLALLIDGAGAADGGVNEVVRSLEEGFSISDQVRLYEDVMDLIAGTFDVPDREKGKAQLKVIEERLVEGDFGGVALIMVPAMTRLHDRFHNSVDMLRVAREHCVE